uniref:Uncharacterized protein n=1 Tax=Plectus sambesii TaxID=2011161 RepID=A0A914V584_9BILA
KDYHEAAKKLFTVAYLYETAPENLPASITTKSRPAVVAFKDGGYFEYDETKDGNLSVWMQTERWPAFPLVNYGNLYDIGLCCNKLLVLAILDIAERRKTTTSIGKFSSLVERVAKENHDKLKTNYQFGWLDGNEIANGVILGVVPIPGILIFNVTSYQYYLCEDAPDQITKDSLLLW